jgi:hypothetical protein
MKLLAILGGWMVAMATGALLMWYTTEQGGENPTFMFTFWYIFGGVELLVALMIYLYTRGIEAGKKGR